VAYALPQEDDQVDELYNDVSLRLVETMINNPTRIDLFSQISWVIHNLERTADHVTNICERIIFIATGDLIELDTRDNEEEDEPDAPVA
jgi:phosphate transport system protein